MASELTCEIDSEEVMPNLEPLIPIDVVDCVFDRCLCGVPYPMR
jgi:hypothetical protein